MGLKTYGAFVCFMVYLSKQIVMAKSKKDTKRNNFFEKFANAATKFTGSSVAFIDRKSVV